MTQIENSLIALERCTCGNAEAKEFLLLWRRYCHEIDDLVDGATRGPEALLGAFALALSVYSAPFYLRNLLALRQVAWTISNAYTDSAHFEQATDWRRQWADHHRHAGTEMVLAVAQICGGYEHMRSISAELRTVCWCEHHDREGKPQ